MPDHHFTPNPHFVDCSNPSQLSDRLYLAGMATAKNHALLRALGITAVVNLTPDDDSCHGHFKQLHIKIDDGADFPDGVLPVFLDTMAQWDRAGEVVLIHCHAGISRTSAFAIAWLMHQRGCNRDSDLRRIWSECEDQVGRVRPIIQPHVLLKRAVLRYFEGVPACA